MIVWDAASLVEVKVTEPLALKACVQFNARRRQRRVEAVDRVDVAGAGSVGRSVSVVVPDAVLKISVLPCSEFVPALVRSVAVPGTASGPAPVGAAMATVAFDV